MIKDKSKYSAASKARWAGIPIEKRRERMRSVIRVRWDNTSEKDRKEQMRKMREIKKYGNASTKKTS